MTERQVLPQFQRDFASGLLASRGLSFAPGALRLDAVRYAVYARNTQASLSGALNEAYPVIRRVVGIDFFAEMADQFVAAHPPTHGWLSAYGDGFPDFVGQYGPATELGYLSDVARIEWARIHAGNAPDDPALDLKALTGLDPEVLPNLVLKLHRAATLVSSRFPVFDIWRAHHLVSSDDQVPQVDLECGSQSVLISRPAMFDVGVALLSPGDLALLETLAQGAHFGAACQAAVRTEMNYDLSSSLGELVYRRALAAL
jgi:hypothetical protein